MSRTVFFLLPGSSQVFSILVISLETQMAVKRIEPIDNNHPYIAKEKLNEFKRLALK